MAPEEPLRPPTPRAFAVPCRAIKARLFQWLLIAALFYGVGYLVSVQKRESFVGSVPINDPTRSRTVSVEPTYRFLPATFRASAHR